MPERLTVPNPDSIEGPAGQIAERYVTADMINSRQGNMPPAIVFPARQTNSLGVIRSLGKKGIPVIGLDYQPMSVGFFSRYCKARLCPDPAIFEDRFIDSLSPSEEN